jgi:hypothetical protein
MPRQAASESNTEVFHLSQIAKLATYEQRSKRRFYMMA